VSVCTSIWVNCFSLS